MTNIIKSGINTVVSNIGTFLFKMPVIGRMLNRFVAAKNKERILERELDDLLGERIFGLTRESQKAIPLPKLTKMNTKMDFHDASSIYFAYFETNSPAIQVVQPNKRLSKLKKGIWYMRNTKGLLARIGTVSNQVFITNVAT